ncbi:uncharacterized protein N7518_001080 [Penicillium psychrosexuale]|uniref:uncharacterized protein n=1 Tax=Penicillium psychrosexuale TaxID=1002107 RepID=UPI002545246A|nr:uncharacterized protein N7518_001080 [Penicillium psychrosexuale]KAJ5804777.1 hypothetical protein N7518_001080 [Penicillium psychrosexuale]
MSLSQPSASAVGFLSLPVEVRNEVYKYVLTVPDTIYLFQDPGGPVQSFEPQKPYRWLALLYINRQIYDEAKVVLYGTNHFTLQEVETMQSEGGLLKSFLNCIGPTKRVEGQSGEVRLREDSLQSFQLLQKEFTHLKTLETIAYSRNSRSLLQGNLDDTKPAQEVFLEIDAQLKGIVSLKKFTIRVYSGSPDTWAREFLQKLGWVVLINR